MLHTGIENDDGDGDERDDYDNYGRHGGLLLLLLLLFGRLKILVYVSLFGELIRRSGFPISGKEQVSFSFIHC